MNSLERLKQSIEDINIELSNLDNTKTNLIVVSIIKQKLHYLEVLFSMLR